MSAIQLEHVNITVSDPARSADMLHKLFGWKTRWHGTAMNGDGITYHVGTDDTYIALYSGKIANGPTEVNYDTIGGLNHVAVLVDDIEAVEKRIIDAGYIPKSHADYEPGKRFYFFDHDNIEFEVVCYS
ncbi:MAG: VOC family protein [Pseudomonadota bacterium]